MKFTVNSKPTLDSLISTVTDQWEKHKYMEVELFAGKRRTVTQNKALHLWLEMLAQTLNDAGLDMRTVLKPDVDIPWSKHTCKEHLWRPVQQALVGKESTTECKTVEYGEVRDVLVRHLQEKFGVTCPPWPHNYKNGG